MRLGVAEKVRSLIYEKINKCRPTLQNFYLALDVIKYIIEPTNENAKSFSNEIFSLKKDCAK